MLSAFQKLMKRKQNKKPMQTKIARQDIPIDKRMSEIVNELKAFKGKKVFISCFLIKSVIILL